MSRHVDVSAEWERHAEAWLVWTRTPGHDVFDTETWPLVASVLPGPVGLTVDVGCGEGRSSRALAAMGHRVIGVDRSPTLARAAAEAAPSIPVVLSDASRLPLADGVADLVVACMSLHDLHDLAGAVHEAARVLSSHGCLVFAIVHPFITAQDPRTFHSGEPAFHASYLHERQFADPVERRGLQMTFTSIHRPLSAYVDALSAAGFAVTRLREWATAPLPWLLVIRADKRPDRITPIG